MTDETAQHSHHDVEITVNNKQVHIAGPKASGLEIKQAAIAQGVQIEADFRLAEIKPDGKHKIIGDNESVALHDGLRFVATAPDDNSQE
jgi:NAD(P)H-flavin reductase